MHACTAFVSCYLWTTTTHPRTGSCRRPGLGVHPRTSAHCLVATRRGYGAAAITILMCLTIIMQGGGGNPFANMGNLMENVKKAQMMVQQETARVQQELQECVCG